MLSRKRNDVVDPDIFEPDGSGALGSDERELDALARGSGALFTKDVLDATEDQSLGRAAFVRGACLEALVERRRDVNRGAHENILPYLWLRRECGRLRRKSREASQIHKNKEASERQPSDRVPEMLGAGRAREKQRHPCKTRPEASLWIEGRPRAGKLLARLWCGGTMRAAGRCRAYYLRDRISVRRRFGPAERIARRDSFWRESGVRRDYRARRYPSVRLPAANRKPASDSKCIPASASIHSPRLRRRCPSKPERSASPIRRVPIFSPGDR